MTTEAVEQVIAETIASLPTKIRHAMNNVAFVVEGEHRLPTRNEKPIRRGVLLLGLYQGVPLLDRGANYQWVLPDKITIFQDAIESLTNGDEKRTSELVRDTVLHEIAHHLGFRETEVRQWEHHRKQRRSKDQ